MDVTGADVLCDVLLANGVDVCFANPGTSEMHFVAALDRRPEMRCVLGLFEGVVTGAADGYGRMTRRPAATLLHTGPGLVNGLANLHNARRARTPLVCIVGDHAAYHLPYDPPLASDIESLAGPMSDWVRRITGPDDVADATQAAIDAAISLSGIATLILPADASWSEATVMRPSTTTPSGTPAADHSDVAAIARHLRSAGPRAAILIGHDAAIGDALISAGRIAAKTGAKLLDEVFIARTQRGRGMPAARRLPYPIDAARAELAGIDLLLVVGTREPVAFFAYPGKPSRLIPEHCQVVSLAPQAIPALAEALDATETPYRTADGSPPPAIGPLTDDTLSTVLARHIPEGGIVVCEPLTSARAFEAVSAGAARHDFIYCPSGGAIGAGLPMATGAAVGAPGRKVLCLQADGSGLYTLQSLWTQARERLDVVTVIFSNRRYAILEMEMANLGLGTPQENARRMMQLDDPPLDWVALARGMGVDGTVVATGEALDAALTAAMDRPGPYLIECLI